MSLVGRDGELRRLQAGFDESARGNGRILLIGGPVAIGKTGLLEAFAGRARSAGATVASASGSSNERNLSLSVIGQLFASAGVPSNVVNGVMDIGQCLADVEPGSSTTERTLVTLLQAVAAALLALAVKQPLVIAVDDIDVSDDLSLRAILYLVRRIRSANVLVLLTQLASPQPTRPNYYAELMRQPHCSSLTLAPLSRQDTVALLSRDLGPVRAARIGAECYDVTGGNPMLIRALGTDQPAPADDASIAREDRLVVGNTFERAIISCLYRSPPGYREVAHAIAMLDNWTSPALISRLSGMDTAAVDRALAGLRSGGLLYSQRLRHHVARHAILADIPGPAVSQLHRRAAELLHMDAATPMAIAEHLLQSDDVAPPWAAATLRLAADNALDSGEAVFSADCLRAAYECSLDDSERAQVRAAVVRAQWREDPALALRYFDELNVAIRRGYLTGRDALMQICRMLWYGQTDEALLAIERFGRASDFTSAELVADLRFTRAWVKSVYPGLPIEQQFSSMIDAAAPLSATAVPELKAADVLSAVLDRGVDEGAVVIMEQVLKRTVLDDYTLMLLTTGVGSLLHADRLEEAASWCDRLGQQARTRRAPTWQAIVMALRATVSLRAGDLEIAAEGCRRAFDLLEPDGWGVAIGLPLSTLLQAATSSGDLSAAARWLDQPIPESMFQSTFGLAYLHARGSYYLGTGRPKAALSDFYACGNLMVSWGIDTPAYVPWRAEAAQAWLLIGRPGTAQELINDQLHILGDQPSRARGLTLWLQAAITADRQHLALLTEAVSILATTGDRLSYARAVHDLERAQRQLGDGLAARQQADGRAWSVAAEFNTGQSQQITLPRAAHPPGMGTFRPTGVASTLSDAELRVATQAARGRTNREIAQALFITVSTVEQHLTRVYRKLGVNRRADLALRLRTPRANLAS